MNIPRHSLMIGLMYSLLILCSGCASQHTPAATIPAGTSLAHPSGLNAIPAGPGVGSAARKLP